MGSKAAAVFAQGARADLERRARTARHRAEHAPRGLQLRMRRELHALARRERPPALARRRATPEPAQQRLDLGHPEAGGLRHADQREAIEDVVAVDALPALAFGARNQPARS